MLAYSIEDSLHKLPTVVGGVWGLNVHTNQILAHTFSHGTLA